MTAPESIAASINQIDEKKANLKEAFDDLQPHLSLLSPSFNLSWSDIDSHFSSAHSFLLNSFRLLQSASNSPNSDKIEASAVDTPEPPPVLWPELRNFCEKNDGKGLGKYMIDNSKKRLLIKPELPSAIRCSENPAALVVDALEGSYHCSSPPSARVLDVRRISVLLLEALIEINPNLTDDLRERARTLAYDWKSNIGNKPSEALGFLHLVAAFELGSLFRTEELCNYMFLICKHKQATRICKKLGIDRNRIGALIQKFLDTGRLLVAVRFIYEKEMTDEFEPVQILKTSLKNSREAAKRVCAEGNYSLHAQNEGNEKELNALRTVSKVVRERNLELEFVEEKLEERMKELEDQKAKRKLANTKKPQQYADKKRPRVPNVATNSKIPPMSLQYPHLPDPSQSLQMNPYGLLGSRPPGVAVPYGNPLALYGSVPPTTSQPFYYEQQNGYGGYRLPP